MDKKKNLLMWYSEGGVDVFLNESATDRMTQKLKKEHHAPDRDLNSSRAIADRCATLEELEAAVRMFDGCAIKGGAAKTVFAEGAKQAEVMFIGEAPGAKEDEQGIPFCGPSGKLLNNIMLSIGINREDAYITNTVFWRPPGNRRPTAEEIEICRPFVEKHVALINPKLIVLVGNTAVESLLDMKAPMHSLRGKEFDYSNKYLQKPIKTVVIFHPSYLLRQASKKKEMWIDVANIKNKFL